MDNKKSKCLKIIGAVVLVVLVIWSLKIFFGKKNIEQNQPAENYQDQQSAEYIEADIEALVDYSSLCEAGEWIVLTEEGEGVEKLNYKGRIKVADDESYVSEDEKYLFSILNGQLEFFVGREIEAVGQSQESMGRQEFLVEKIKCSGAEADQVVVAERKQVMRHIAENIASLAPEDPQKGKWEVDEFYYMSEKDFYVVYFSEDDDDDEYYEERILLLRTKSVDKFDQLAYFEVDEEGEYILKDGEDIYEDSENFTVYEYDNDQDEWVLTE